MTREVATFAEEWSEMVRQFRERFLATGTAARQGRDAQRLDGEAAMARCANGAVAQEQPQ